MRFMAWLGSRRTRRLLCAAAVCLVLTCVQQEPPKPDWAAQVNEVLGGVGQLLQQIMEEGK